jgi:hypothetical protein
MCLRRRDCCLDWRRWRLQTGGYCYWWEIIPSGSLSLRKELQLGGCLGVETRMVGIALAEGLHDWGQAGRATFELNPGIYLTTKEKHGKPWGSRMVLDTNRCAVLTALLGAVSTGLLGIGHPRLTAGDFIHPLVCTSAFQFAELRGSLHQLTSIRSSQVTLWCGRRK